MNGNGFSFFDFFEYVIFELLPRLAFFAVILCLGLWLYSSVTQVNSDKASAAHKVAAGTLKTVSVETSWFGDTSVMTLEDGTTVRLSGSINPWKVGEAVTTAQVKEGDSTVTYWCVGQTCLEQN